MSEIETKSWWEKVKWGWKVAGLIFIAGVTFAKFEMVQNEVSDLKQRQEQAIHMQTDIVVLQIRIADLQTKLNRMDDKLDKLIGRENK